MPNCLSRAFVVRFDILATNIGDETLVPIWCAIHDQTTLLRGALSEPFGAEKNSQFQWHVEPG